ncbi:hypothetical protein FGO68_gene6308 [Halteria grandinella]|uniref:Uncharacterized protein n=1 Tax=Halteria grandinella TaxID=5974 RepID=A0A8J8NRG1_HALGN|nr:hypothetical protein FGO68_gene6308 [Halteria grandinella]
MEEGDALQLCSTHTIIFLKHHLPYSTLLSNELMIEKSVLSATFSNFRCLFSPCLFLFYILHLFVIHRYLAYSLLKAATMLSLSSLMFWMYPRTQQTACSTLLLASKMQSWNLKRLESRWFASSESNLSNTFARSFSRQSRICSRLVLASCRCLSLKQDLAD